MKTFVFILGFVIIVDVCVAYSFGLLIRFGGPGDMPGRGQADHGFQGNRFSANRNNDRFARETDRFGVQDRFVCDCFVFATAVVFNYCLAVEVLSK